LGFSFVLLKKRAFDTTTEEIYLRTGSNGNFVRFRDKAKLRDALVKDMLFADNAGIANNTQQEL